MEDRSKAYLALAVLGGIVPVVIFGAFVADYGFGVVRFWNDVVGSIPAVMVFADIFVSSLVFWFWMSREAPTAGMRRWWPFVVANLLVGLSFALLLFLYFRERRRDTDARLAVRQTASARARAPRAAPRCLPPPTRSLARRPAPAPAV